MRVPAKTPLPNAVPTPAQSGVPAPILDAVTARNIAAPSEGSRDADVPERMTAVAQRRYGGPETLQVTELDTPQPGALEILLRVEAADVSTGDVHLATGRPFLVRAAGFGLLRPSAQVPGRSFAGVVVAIGEGVTGFAPGDHVLGSDERGGGALAEYKTVHSGYAVRRPANLSAPEAAALPWAITALQAVRQHARTSTGGRVLVHGASGGVGHFAVQIAAGLGMDVTATYRAGHRDWLVGLGARRAIDTTREDPFARAGAYDAILDLVGDRSPAQLRRALCPRGNYLAIGGDFGDWLGFPLRMARISAAGTFRSQSLRPMVSSVTRADLLAVAAAAEAGRLTPTVSATFPLERAADAFRSVQRGGTRGKTVVTMG